MTANRGAFFLLTWFSLSHGAFFVSLVVSVYWWIYTLSLPFIGAIVDIKSKFKVSLIGCFITFMAIIDIVYFIHDISKTSIIISTVLLSTGAMVFTASSISYSANLVSNKTQLASAFKYRSLILSFTTFIGPSLGGILLVIMGHSSMALFFMSLALCASLLFFKLPIDKDNDVGSVSFNLSKWFDDSKAGFRAVRKIPTEYSVAIFIMMLNFFITPFLGVALPLLAVNQYHFSSTELGVILAFFGIGIVFGSTIITFCKIPEDKNFVLCFTSVVLLGLSFILIAIKPYYIEMFALVFLAGVSIAFFNTIVTACRAAAIPDEYRSRIETFVLFIAQISIPIGTSVSGILFPTFGVNNSVILFGLCIILSSISLIFVPNFRDLLMQRNDETNDETYYKRQFPEAFD